MFAREYFLYIRKAFNEFSVINVVTDSIYAAIGARYCKSLIKIDRISYEDIYSHKQRSAIYKYNKEHKIKVEMAYEFYNNSQLYYVVVKNKESHMIFDVYESPTMVTDKGEYYLICGLKFEKRKYSVKTVKNDVYFNLKY